MDGLFPTGTLSATAATRELVAALRRVSQEDLAASIAGIAAAIASRIPLDTLDALGVGPGVAPLLGACMTDAARSLLPESAVREWWESAGLDSERATTVAHAVVAAAPAITAQLESEGVAATRVVLLSSMPTFVLSLSLSLQASAFHSLLTSNGRWTTPSPHRPWAGSGQLCYEWT